MDFDIVAKLDSGVGGGLADAILAADEKRAAEPLIDEGERGADDLFLFAFREDHALGEAPHALEDRLQRARDRIAPGGKLRLVGFEIDDRPARDARVHRRFRHRRRHDGDQPRDRTARG